MTHAEIRRALAERVRALLDSPENLPLELRPYQLDTLRAICAWLEDLAGSRRGYVEQATGLGKTALFAALAGFCTDLRVLIVVPTLILVEQTARATVKFTGGMLGYLGTIPSIKDEHGQVIAVRGHSHSNVVITTDESFARSPGRIASQFQPHLIVFDECHWGFIGITSWALNQFPEAVIIGFSATPDYLTTMARPGYAPVTIDNGQVLYASPERLAKAQFGTLLDRRTVPWGISNGWLAPMAWGQVDFNVSLEGLPVYESEVGLDYQVNALTRFMEQHWSQMTKAISRLYIQGQYGLSERQVFAVCPSVVAAEELAQAIRQLGIPSACITGHTPAHERQRILRAYASNEIRLLTSVMVLREGWDAPNAEVCLMLRPTKSRVLYVQAVGRVLRPAPGGKAKVALVLDGHFEDTTFEPLSAPALFAPVGSKVARGDIILQVNQGAEGPARPMASPYVTNGAETYRVEQIAVERCAGQDGLMFANGEVWGTERGLAKKLGTTIHYIQIWAVRGKARSRLEKIATGQTATFYALADVVGASGVTGLSHPDVETGAIADRAKAVWETLVPQFNVEAAAPLEPVLLAPAVKPVKESIVPTPEAVPGSANPPWADAASGTWGKVVPFKPRAQSRTLRPPAKPKQKRTISRSIAAARQRWEEVNGKSFEELRVMWFSHLLWIDRKVQRERQRGVYDKSIDAGMDLLMQANKLYGITHGLRTRAAQKRRRGKTLRVSTANAAG